MIPDKKTKSSQIQLQIGMVLLALFLALGLFFAMDSKQYAFYWVSGLAFGYVLQKSRFCFTAGFRDVHLLGSTLVGRAVLLALALTTLGFTMIKYAHVALGLPIPGMVYVNPIGLYTILGGLLFGIGMVIAEGCASGVLMRLGDGFATQLVVLVFFVLGNFMGAKDVTWWEQRFSLVAEGVFLPDILGWPLALLAQLALIALLYRWAKKWEEKKMED